MWAPGVQDRRGEFAFQGITGAANVISESLIKTLSELEQHKKEDAFNRSVITHLSQTKGPDGKPYVPADLLLEFEKGNSSKKTGIVNAALANASFDAQQQKAAREDALAKAHADYYQKAKGAAGAFKPSVTSLVDPQSGEPFSVYSRGPNQVDLTPGSAASELAGQPVVHPETGKVIGIYDRKGNPKYFAQPKAVNPKDQAMADLLSGADKQTATAAPAAAAATTATPEMRALAQKALNDPAATPEQKAAARKILGL